MATVKLTGQEARWLNAALDVLARGGALTTAHPQLAAKVAHKVARSRARALYRLAVPPRRAPPSFEAFNYDVFLRELSLRTCIGETHGAYAAQIIEEGEELAVRCKCGALWSMPLGVALAEPDFQPPKRKEAIS